MTDEAAPSPPEFTELARLVAESAKTHGADAALFAFREVFMPMLSVVTAFRRETVFIKAITDHELTGHQALDALALVAALRHADNAHHAWLAAEILLRHTANPALLVAALAGAGEPHDKVN